MLCPRCGAELAHDSRQSVEIDTCPECRGVWLDRGELEKILREQSDRLEAPPPADLRHRAGTRRGRREQSTWRRLFD